MRLYVQKVSNYAAVTTAVMMPALALANEPDVSSAVTYIGYATAAIVSIGVAKLVPSAAIWLYSSLTGMVKRG